MQNQNLYYDETERGAPNCLEWGAICLCSSSLQKKGGAKTKTITIITNKNNLVLVVFASNYTISLLPSNYTFKSRKFCLYNTFMVNGEMQSVWIHVSVRFQNVLVFRHVVFRFKNIHVWVVFRFRPS